MGRGLLYKCENPSSGPIPRTHCGGWNEKCPPQAHVFIIWCLAVVFMKVVESLRGMALPNMVEHPFNPAQGRQRQVDLL